MIYLDNAATTFPKPQAVYREAERVMRECGGNPGRGGHSLALAAAREIYRCREAVAELLGGEPDRVVLTQNATQALNLTLKGILQKGDHVLTSALAHNSVRRPLHDLEKMGVEVEHYPIFSREPLPTLIGRMIRPSTRVVEITLRSNICSLELPLEEIAAVCRGKGSPKGIILVVDASQAAGARPIALGKLGKAVICAAGHKGLYGLMGSGFALFSKEIAPQEVTSLLSGGSGVGSKDAEMPDLFPERLEAGTQNPIAAASLRAGIEAVRAVGVEEIDRRERLLRRRLTAMLIGLGRVKVYLPHADSGAIVLFNHRSYSAEEVSDYLNSRGICTRAGLHCAPMAHQLLATPEGGALRASLGMFTTEEEITALWRAMREM